MTTRHTELMVRPGIKIFPTFLGGFSVKLTQKKGHWFGMLTLSIIKKIERGMGIREDTWRQSGGKSSILGDMMMTWAKVNQVRQ